MHAVLLIERGVLRDQVEIGRSFPMRVEAVEERLGIGAAIELGQMVRESTVLQTGLITANKNPIIVRSE